MDKEITTKSGDPTVEVKREICTGNEEIVLKVLMGEEPMKNQECDQEDVKMLQLKSGGETDKNGSTDFENIPSNLVKSGHENFLLVIKKEDIKIEADLQSEVNGETGPGFTDPRTNEKIYLQENKSRVMLALNDEPTVVVDSFCLTSSFTEKGTTTEESGINVDGNSQIHSFPGAFYSQELLPSAVDFTAPDTIALATTLPERESAFEAFGDNLICTPRTRESGFEASRDDTRTVVESIGLASIFKSGDCIWTGSTIIEDGDLSHALCEHEQTVLPALSITQLRPSTATVNLSEISERENVSKHHSISGKYQQQDQPHGQDASKYSSKRKYIPLCVEKFNTSSRPQNRLVAQDDEKPYSSPFRDDELSECVGVSYHDKTPTPQKRLREIRPKQFSASSGLLAPGSVHSCNEPLSTSSHLTVQESVYSGSKKFKCDVCSKRFPRPSQLKTHGRVHSGIKPYKCDVCAKQFSTSSGLTVHQKALHPGSYRKTFKCRVCFEQFSTTAELNVHKIVHSGKKTYKCDVCFKQFASSSYLRKHKTVHSGSKPYPCYVCSKQFPSLPRLKSHELIHSGSKPYTCDVCFKQFLRKSGLKIHETVHSESKPYMCHVCSKQFKTSDSLRKHEKVHSNCQQ